MAASTLAASALVGRALAASALAARAVVALACALALATWLPPAASADISLLWEPSASLFWTINHTAIMALFQNGQCTELAADRRPDLVRQIVVGFIANELAHGLVEAMPNLDARYWPRDAAAVGIPTGHTPRPGALIVFQPRVLGASAAGHIAYVIRVRRRSFTIAEMNAPLPYRVTRRTLPIAAARLPGVTFIY